MVSKRARNVLIVGCSKHKRCKFSCLKCKQVYDKAYKKKNRQRLNQDSVAYYHRHKPRVLRRQKRYYYSNHHKVLKAARADRLKRHFGLTVNDYKQLLRKQRGRCGICKSLPKKIRLAVDHDHQTGVVRGLLCAPCNFYLGYFEKMGQKMKRYLRRTR